MPTDQQRHALSGPTMGTRWTALFHTEPGFDPEPLRARLQAAVDDVDARMSTWKPDSELMRLSAAPVGKWIGVSPALLEVLDLGLAIGRASGGAFDIGMGDAVTAWGFGPDAASGERIRNAMQNGRRPAHELIEIHEGKLRKAGAMTLDLNGIAKGYGVDRLAGTLIDFGITSALAGIDGEMRALGARPGGRPWAIAVEAPDTQRRAAHSIIELRDGAVATSGDYRHWVDVNGRRLSHTMDPARGAPLAHAPASVSVLAPSCAEADAWATALMVLGVEEGTALARARGLDALFLLRKPDGEIAVHRVGRSFA